MNGFKVNSTLQLLHRTVFLFSFLFFYLIILLLFSYSCLHLPPHPSQTHLPPLLLPHLGFVHVSFIVVPENFSPHYPFPPALW